MTGCIVDLEWPAVHHHLLDETALSENLPNLTQVQPPTNWAAATRSLSHSSTLLSTRSSHLLSARKHRQRCPFVIHSALTNAAGTRRSRWQKDKAHRSDSHSATPAIHFFGYERRTSPNWLLLHIISAASLSRQPQQHNWSTRTVKHSRLANTAQHAVFRQRQD